MLLLDSPESSRQLSTGSCQNRNALRSSKVPTMSWPTSGLPAGHGASSKTNNHWDSWRWVYLKKWRRDKTKVSQIRISCRHPWFLFSFRFLRQSPESPIPKNRTSLAQIQPPCVSPILFSFLVVDYTLFGPQIPVRCLQVSQANFSRGVLVSSLTRLCMDIDHSTMQGAWGGSPCQMGQ